MKYHPDILSKIIKFIHMVISFNDRLSSACEEKQNRLCLGLDIDKQRLSSNMDTTIEGLQAFTNDIIDATIDLCPVYKFNLAFYECFGSKGISWLENILNKIDDKAITIADGKRGDIGNTAKKYAESLFGHFNFDAVTLTPYMGKDSILPFISDRTKGSFILCLTSNESAKDLQMLSYKDVPLYIKVAKMICELNIRNNLGLVVGATKSMQMKEISKYSKGLSWLIPGIGTQGGDLISSINISNKDRVGIINVSRGILYAGAGNIKDIRDATKSYTMRIRELI